MIRITARAYDKKFALAFSTVPFDYPDDETSQLLPEHHLFNAIFRSAVEDNDVKFLKSKLARYYIKNIIEDPVEVDRVMNQIKAHFTGCMRYDYGYHYYNLPMQKNVPVSKDVLKILSFIEFHINKFKVAPTGQEIQNHTTISHVAYGHAINEAKNKGLLIGSTSKHRDFVLTEKYYERYLTLESKEHRLPKLNSQRQKVLECFIRAENHNQPSPPCSYLAKRAGYKNAQSAGEAISYLVKHKLLRIVKRTKNRVICRVVRSQM